MGGIIDFKLNDRYPDTFAASLYVGCQPGNEPYDATFNAYLEHRTFLHRKFIYSASSKDPKTPKGQESMMTVMEQEKVAEGYGIEEHMHSFRYVHALDPLFEWLMGKRK